MKQLQPNLSLEGHNVRMDYPQSLGGEKFMFLTLVWGFKKHCSIQTFQMTTRCVFVTVCNFDVWFYLLSVLRII